MKDEDSPGEGGKPLGKLAIMLWATDPQEPHRCATPFFHAAAAAAMGAEVEVYFTGHSVRLLARGVADALKVRLEAQFPGVTICGTYCPPFRPLDADLRWIGVLCYRNGALEETGLAAGVLNHPANGIAWLANKLAPLGLALEPGQIVLSGSFIRPIETRKGDTIQADYGPYGMVSCHFG